jgi:small conductance mechanosensitive channel
MTLTSRALPTPHLSWAIPIPASIGGNGGWFYDLLHRAGLSSSLAHNLVEFVLRPLEVVLVVLVAWVVARLGGRAVRGLVTKMGSRRATTPRAVARVQTAAAVIANAWRFVIAVFAIAIVLGMLGINLTPLLASATIIGATLGFGAQMAIRDYLSGFLLTVEDQFGIGDTISVNTVTGTVEELTLRVTRVRVADGSLVFLPNGDIRQLANSSRGWAKAVVEVVVPITSAESLARITEVVTEAAQRVGSETSAAAGCTQAPEVLGLVATEGASGTIRVMLRTNHTHRSVIERALRGAIAGALADAGIWSATSPAGETLPAGDTDPVADGAI